MILFTLCATLFVINALTIGGGYVMLPMLQEEFVMKHHWLTNQEFLDAIAMGQITPGPLTVMNAFIGYKIAGLSGALLAMASSYLPCIIIVTLVAKFYYSYKDSTIVSASFRGVKAAVIGLLAAVSITLGESSLIDPITVTIAVGSFAVIAFTKLEPTFVIVGAGIVGWLFC
ncbi:MAG: chromate transporter [Desulfovibrionaceae bacterium]|nr:chromate transporter [Desulfovibrionaceae bacterium]MBF0514231.1 chromate transporter [Desulfovibrionaceae bacterium]